MRTALLLLGLTLPAGEGPASGTPRSERVASYEIRADLLPEERTVRGEAWVLFRNPGPQPVTSLWFHLYANAFRNSETVFLRESREGTDLLRKEETIRRGTWGWIQVDSVRSEDGADLAGSARFRETLMEVPLPAPVPPGKTVRIGIGFRTRLPRTIARMGYRGDHFDVMQWFPKLAALRDGRWNLHDFHADSEFFADFGAYDVTLSVPPEYEVEATGVRVGAETRAEGNRVLRFRAEDVHDFAWVADPRFGRATDVHRGVEIVYLHQPAHRRHADRILASVRTCLDFYADHLMEYPYPRIVIDDLPMGLSGGMEYPMLFTITIHWAQPRFVRSPEGVTIHE
ncbi:MAG: hypothetical protein HY509_03775, partial [Acidobacteria bacterium]|nr:hypothetical protein [Acidobacteriota bacterium]